MFFWKCILTFYPWGISQILRLLLSPKTRENWHIIKNVQHIEQLIDKLTSIDNISKINQYITRIMKRGLCPGILTWFPGFLQVTWNKSRFKESQRWNTWLKLLMRESSILFVPQGPGGAPFGSASNQRGSSVCGSSTITRKSTKKNEIHPCLSQETPFKDMSPIYFSVNPPLNHHCKIEFLST